MVSTYFLEDFGQEWDCPGGEALVDKILSCQNLSFVSSEEMKSFSKDKEEWRETARHALFVMDEKERTRIKTSALHGVRFGDTADQLEIFFSSQNEDDKWSSVGWVTNLKLVIKD